MNKFKLDDFYLPIDADADDPAKIGAAAAPMENFC